MVIIGEDLFLQVNIIEISNHPFFKDEKINHSVLKLYIFQHFIPPPFGLLKNTFSVFQVKLLGLVRMVTYSKQDIGLSQNMIIHLQVITKQKIL